MDGKSVFYRGYYAMGALSLPDGTPTGGVYGFAAIAMEIVRKLNPTKVVVAWDSKTSTAKRRSIFPDYKAGRIKPGEDFYAQIPLLEDLVESLGWAFVELDNYEADDIIGTFSREADELGNYETYIISSDLDMLQIVDENTHMWRILKGFTNIEQIDIKELEEKYGIKKSQFLDLKALKGDSSDNIPGVPGIGEKTAAKLLNEYGTLDNIYANLEELSGAIKTKLKAGKDSAYLSKTLAKIMFDAPVDLKTLPDFVFNREKTIAGLKKLDFNSLIRKFTDSESSKSSLKPLNSFRFTEPQKTKLKGPLESSSVSTPVLSENSSALPSLKSSEISTSPEPSCAPLSSVEATKIATKTAEITEVAKATEVTKTAKIPETSEPTKIVETAEIAKTTPLSSVKKSPSALFKTTFDTPFSETPQKVSFTLKELLIDWDIKYLMHHNEGAAESILSGDQKFWDLSQAAFLLNPLSREDPHLVLFEEGYRKQKSALKAFPKLENVLETLDFPLIPILYKMEKKGMLIDRTYFNNLKEEYTKICQSLEQTIFGLVGKTFNLNSPLQLSEILFVDLRLPTRGIKKTSKSYSTGAKELEKLKDAHPVVAKIIEYREASKLLSTYIIPIPGLADSNNRIHTTFTQNVTATGRLSSLNPNLQNIPVRTEAGRRIRTGFIAPPGRVLVSADYSQFELRLAAALSNDTALINDFNNGIDIHTKTASETFRVPLLEVSYDQRRAAKVINFGILYGMSMKGLSDATGMTVPEAKKFIDDYFALRAPIKRYLENTLKKAREQGYVETFYGRRRPTPDVNSPSFLIRSAAERAAMNMPIQGTEADLMKRAMIEIDKALPKTADLIMQVHDSLIAECDEKDAETVAKILKEKMESIAPELGVKLAVEVSTAKNWGEL
ncbi:MAG: DNA polymerase I [Candidatus Saccharibacteria bacterium]|nr:DNA polymerase I [Candidatus Saccharibacteria bacterium]